ncbi:hypothetical protein Scep_015629 [Stephania cephalantha]|uniref:DNA N(6)-methyladenine demethylase n=1 Tax=Stephania cephalantha TaxID=152367 RepID=A0AAP0J5H3_9MAGN
MLSRPSIRRLSPPLLRNSVRSINLLRCRNLSNMSDRRKPNLGHNQPRESGRGAWASRHGNKDMKPQIGGKESNGSALIETTMGFTGRSTAFYRPRTMSQQPDISRNARPGHGRGSSEWEGSGDVSRHIWKERHGLASMGTEIRGPDSPTLASVSRDTSPQHVSLANEGRLDNRRPSPGRVVSPPKSSGHSVDMPPPPVPFDICFVKREGPPKLKAPLHLKNKERRNELAKSSEQNILRPGMILLKNYLSPSDQIKITTVCRDLGVGTGGFYQPGYNDGAKLHLRMMCLGKNWDPQTRAYGEYRSIDGTVAPAIPEDFQMLVEKAIQDSHALIKKKRKVNNPENILPGMQPDLCIVNFYSETGKLGLHQDRDESRESLDQGLPVVSFSIGDSADFLYGDTRNVDEAKKVVLESGDVLIFGGESRHVFHGVPSINKGTAPKSLTEETNLRPGRLNLTFRKY